MEKDRDETNVDKPVSNAESKDAAPEDTQQTVVVTNTAQLSGEFGRYRVKKLLGQGAMGSVYLAHDPRLNRLIALKVPSFSEGAPENLIARFVREAQSAANLDHPNICPIYDVGEHGGTRFISMAYVEGRPLSDYIKADRQQSQRQAAIVIRKLALALHEAHERGIIHRDLKPANIMVNKRSEPIVMDFGLARQIDDDADSQLTKAGTIVGTPAYMAPEQLTGTRDLGPATDIYSLGVILYELLTGKRPFSGSVVTVITQVLHSDPPPIEDLRKDASPDLAAICRRAMAKKPADRYASMRNFAEDLARFLKGDSLPTKAAAAPLAPLPDPLETDSIPADTRAVGQSPGVPLSQTISIEGNRVSFSPIALIAGAAVLVLISIGVAGLVFFGFGGTDNDLAPTSAAVADTPAEDPDGSIPQPPVASATSDLRQGKPQESAPHEGSSSFPPRNKMGRDGPRSRDRRNREMGHGMRLPPADLTSKEKFVFLDTDKSSALELDEILPHVIRRGDANGDGTLSMEEFVRAYERFGEEFYGPPDKPGSGRPPGPRGFRP